MKLAYPDRALTAVGLRPVAAPNPVSKKHQMLQNKERFTIIAQGLDANFASELGDNQLRAWLICRLSTPCTWRSWRDNSKREFGSGRLLSATITKFQDTMWLWVEMLSEPSATM